MYNDAVTEDLLREERNLEQRLADVRQRLAEVRRYQETPPLDMEAIHEQRRATIAQQQEAQRKFEEEQEAQLEARYRAKERAGLVTPRDDSNSDATRESEYLGERR